MATMARKRPTPDKPRSGTKQRRAASPGNAPGGATPTTKARPAAEPRPAPDPARRPVVGAAEAGPPPDAPAPAQPPHLIVGIGTSAGGLEALRHFFVRLPRDSGLAFVLVPHLDAQNKSALVELLQQETPIHVVEATDGVAVRPDHAYVIPPNATMTIDSGRLKLASPRAHPLTIAIERDITELKRAEEQQKTLIAELNHRVKNTMASVISIAASTMLGRSSLEEFRPVFEGRIRALANAHDLLSRSGWNGADLRDIVATELEPYSEDHTVSVQGGRLILAASAALTLAMIVHELATNASKYGALSTAGGAIDIAWSVAGGRLIFRWQERKGPTVSRPERLGFGLRLIERSAANDLQGEAAIEFDPGGLRCTIDIPVAELTPRTG
jgi:two-component sensor histidine kinase